MKKTNLTSLGLWAGVALAVITTSSAAHAQNITWGTAQGITGDSNLVDSTTLPGSFSFDALLTDPGTQQPPGSGVFVPLAPLSVDGVTFNASSGSGSIFGDGVISYNITSGANNPYNSKSDPTTVGQQFGSFPVTSPSSTAFAAVMNSGGTFQSGGAGAGTVTIADLTPGNTYAVQVFNYVFDGDAGLTTLSGSSPVTISNAPGAGGSGTNGEFATGQFVAPLSGTETFNWNGAGSSFTVLGAVSVADITAAAVPEPSTYALLASGLVALAFLSSRRRSNSVR